MSLPNQQNILQPYLYRENTDYLNQINVKRKSRIISVNVKCVYPDPENPGELLSKTGSIQVDATKSVDQIKKDFLNTYQDIPNKTYYVGYDQLLFKDGTIEECGITQGKFVELIAPGKNAAVYHNQGLTMIIWSLLPLVFGLAAILFSMTTGSHVENTYQALFFFLGLTFTLPSVVAIFIGLVLIPECPMPCYFNGSEWC